MTYNEIIASVRSQGLMIYGGFHGDTTDGLPVGTTALLMLGPAPTYWQHFTNSPEWLDRGSDPVDRWSGRVIGELAEKLNAAPFLPFGGPPYAPFMSWALKTKRCWSSPVGMLVHDTTGLFVSFRGALAFVDTLDLPQTPAQSPCSSCADRPCKTACPVNALGPSGYAVDTCHAYLNSEPGQVCLSRGCAARRACPISAGANRTDEQSAHHMTYFHK
ncbi:MAG: ferredoxin [Rhodobacteraceae bacterium]|nr:ferredoxin [Paracoccaceae bacterium]